MSDVVIDVEGLSKLYKIGAKKIAYPTLRDSIAGMFKKKEHVEETDFWALDDVSFQVKRGEVVGVIGRNGAGKSTLLKILSRITEPTKGKALIHGRVGSLLEVGTGFHPELTGRENIFLNGSILGMKKSEIARKFDEIVAFSEVEKFIDTPVKHYSSGMYVRLAFAVAAHLEPEILLVDEVLAVGDAQFQKKCMGKMGDVAKEGRTILFVSHNMAAVENLCSRCVYLKDGRVSSDGLSKEVIEFYLDGVKDACSDVPVADRIDRGGSGGIKVVRLNVKRKGCISFELGYSSEISEPGALRFALSINRVNSGCLTYLDSACVEALPVRMAKQGTVTVSLSPDFQLASGTYFINVAVFRGQVLEDHVQTAASFVVDGENPFAWRKDPAGAGACFVKQTWESI